MVVQKTDGLYAAEHSHFKEANKGQVANANASQSSELARASQKLAARRNTATGRKKKKGKYLLIW